MVINMFWKREKTVSKTIQEELNEITLRLNKVERDVFQALSSQKDLTDKVLRKIQQRKEQEEEDIDSFGFVKAKNINTKLTPFG